MKRISYIYGAIVLFVLLLAGCSLFSTPDVIVGKWQQVSVGGLGPVFVTVVEFTDKDYTGTTAGVQTNAGTWSKSGSNYTLTGSFFGFPGSNSTISPTFSNSNKAMTYMDSNGLLEVYNRQ